MRGSNSVVIFIYLPRGLILPPRTSPQVNVDAVPCRLFCKSVTMAWWKTERMISSDAVLRSRYVSPIFSLSYEIIRRVATLDTMEKRLAISTVIASAAASGGAIVVKEFIGMFEKPRKKKFLDAMKRRGLDPKGKTIFLMVDVEENVAKSSKNIGMLRKLT
ncbi:hypothetical protein IGI04_014422 [Brassica rapa subsp. trilocularis]|uniref:Uncharacterized protein n=1 Tax=Brassica rapa subsp. trilocularis TaxID=1813537 RepID=A0ABQ7MMV5_BRACM|nr:hypothetical protein IGI04_014422 [Brassica rapa subsp. trilocularis]